MQAGRIQNMQSQSPFRSLGLEVDEQRASRLGSKRKRQSEAVIMNNQTPIKDQLNSTMPPLQNLILTQSLASSRQQQRRGSVGHNQPPAINISNLPVTPGQNWEAKDLSVHQFVNAHQKSKKDASTVLEPNFKGQFKINDYAKDLHKRNVQKLANLTDLAADSNPNMIQNVSITPVVREVTNQLFDKVKLAPNFNARSRSVISD